MTDRDTSEARSAPWPYPAEARSEIPRAYPASPFDNRMEVKSSRNARGAADKA
jgi:hypothetical protein